MTQHLDRPVTPMIDPSVDADVTTPGGGTPRVPNHGWPPPEGAVPQQFAPAGAQPGHPAPTQYLPTGGAPAGTVPGAVAAEPPLNTLSWLSVVLAFVVSPVAIVLGAISRRQIARTGERGRGLATTGIALGIVFTLMGIVSTVLVLSMATTVTYSTTTPAPVAVAPVPAAGLPSTGSGSSAGASGGTAADPAAASSAGRAQLLGAWLEVAAADATLSENLDAHAGDLDAIKADIATYRDELARFRDTAATVSLSPELRAQVDADLLPSVDTVLSDLDTIVTSSSNSKVQAAAGALSDHATAMENEVKAVIGG